MLIKTFGLIGIKVIVQASWEKMTWNLKMGFYTSSKSHSQIWQGQKICSSIRKMFYVFYS